MNGLTGHYVGTCTYKLFLLPCVSVYVTGNVITYEIAIYLETVKIAKIYFDKLSYKSIDT